MRVHFIAVGGSAMHNLAIALHKKGYHVTGSDDEIREPSLSRLKAHNILPNNIGWNINNINTDINAIVLGMHAREDNLELLEAKRIKLKIYSYPEFLYEATKDKTRIVIGGSHGKTSITAMIIHVLKFNKIAFDFMVGAQLKGFDTMVELHNHTKIAIFEGDEYLASPIDKRPKFHLYKPHIAVLSGVAWDHINVFPTYEIYEQQFIKFLDTTEKNAKVFYCKDDVALQHVINKSNSIITKIPYQTIEHSIQQGITSLLYNNEKYAIIIFGKHNMYNLQAAWQVCQELGVSQINFINAIQTFEGAAKRLELVFKNNTFTMYKDFAHSPSKVKATLEAVAEQFTGFNIIACLELHTFSSLNQNFLKEYEGTLDKATNAQVYFNKHVVAHKKLKEISVQQVKDCFANKNIDVVTDMKEVTHFCKNNKKEKTIYLMMSSGNFDGINFEELSQELDLSK